MSKVLITGMTASQIKTHNKAGIITLAGALKDAVEKSGDHEVDVKPYSISLRDTDDYSKYDRVLVGLGPLKGVGTAYMYEAIQALNDYSDRGSSSVALYCDDTSTAKIGREFKTIVKRPFDYVKPFFMYKREWEYVQNQDSPLFNAHMSVIDILAGNATFDWYWPVFMPSWSFDHGYAAASKICTQAAHHLVSFNPSAYFKRDDISATPRKDSDREYWATVYDPASPAINRMGVETWDVEQVKTDSKVLAEASGLLVPSSIWTPDVQIGTSIGLPVATDWRTLGPFLGESFEALPANIELMTRSERDDLAERQSDALESHTANTTVEAVSKWLES